MEKLLGNIFGRNKNKQEPVKEPPPVSGPTEIINEQDDPYAWYKEINDGKGPSAEEITRAGRVAEDTLRRQKRPPVKNERDWIGQPPFHTEDKPN